MISQELQTCPIDHTPPSTKELQPLTPQSDRRDIHRRLVGPLSTVTLIHALDDFRQTELATPTHIGKMVDEQFHHLATNVTAKYEDAAETLLYGITKTTKGAVMDRVLNMFSETFHLEPYTLAYQKEIYRAATFKDSLHKIVREGYEAQAYTTFNFALPAYLSASGGLSTSKQIAAAVKELGVTGVADIIRAKNFITSLSRLAITANGLYGQSNAYYTEYQEICPVIDLPGLVDFELVNEDEVPKPINVFDLYEKREDGSVGLAATTVEALKYYMNYRNNVLPPDVKLGNVPGPTVGCPVIQTSVRVMQSDFTTRQWADLLEGQNPIAVYDAGRQKLIFKRMAFWETSEFFADILSGTIS